jgi:ribonuclease P protein component
VLKKDISEVIEKGRKISGSDWWARIKEGDKGEIVVMIPKKTVKKAVGRNRIRRKIKESLRKAIFEKKIKIVIYVKKENEKIGDEIVGFL